MAEESADDGISWRNRRSIRQIKAEQRLPPRVSEEGPFAAEPWPPDETLTVPTIFLVEAFTPTSAPALRTALDTYPGIQDQLSRFHAAAREDSRMRREDVYTSLGHVRRVPHFVGAVDPDLPHSFASVDCYQLNVTSSLTLVVAAFTLAPEAADLSDVVRATYSASTGATTIRVSGRLGGLRGRLPWSRPRDYRTTSQMVTGSEQRGQALIARVDRRVGEAQGWFTRYFRGSFAQSPSGVIPAIPVFLTKTAVPFTRDASLWGTALTYNFDVWTCTEGDPWQLKLGSRRDEQSWLAVLAIPEQSLTSAKNGDEVRPGVSHRVFETHFELCGWLAAQRLLGDYVEDIALIRDSNQSSRRRLLPFGRYRTLRNFLSRDALDIATVTRELVRKHPDGQRLRLATPTYVLNRIDGSPEDVPALDVALMDDIRRRAQHLREDNENVVDNLKAAAQFQQAITNLRFQVLVVLLTMVTIGVSVVALFRSP